ncbi:hypothetical protein [Actinomycetospora sp. NBRC 106378]|uniref:hypothetical protein n=1 Tax=Actinomycetospora sp. NBRC 106378 TaxID=3032208 RepID=UPI00249FB94C|nr:hypothetical protein [Actinomycetospora sp. NBRC 106378]GLZ55006.1 hypothetical protein Acsp07_46230 [Actinomycetospora sp. NBRC 106378]
MTRTNAVVQHLLRWGYNNEGARHGLASYLATEPVVEGEPVSPEDYGHAVKRAARLRLIEVIPMEESSVPVPTGLTDLGRQCVEEYEGDPSAWEAAGRPTSGTTINHTTITMGDYGQAAAFTSGDVQQSLTQITTDPERLRDVGRMATEILPLLPEHMHQEVREASQDITRAADDPTDTNRLRAAGARLSVALGPGAAMLTIVRFIIDLLSGGLGG